MNSSQSISQQLLQTLLEMGPYKDPMYYLGDIYHLLEMSSDATSYAYDHQDLHHSLKHTHSLYIHRLYIVENPL